MPDWALRRAVDDVLRGAAGIDTRWAPNPAQLGEITQRHVARVRKAAWQVESLMNAEVEAPEPTADERARVAQRMEAWRAELKRAG